MLPRYDHACRRARRWAGHWFPAGHWIVPPWGNTLRTAVPVNSVMMTWAIATPADRKTRVHWLKIDPIWDPLRTAPRFTAVLKRMGLAE